MPFSLQPGLKPLLFWKYRMDQPDIILVRRLREYIDPWRFSDRQNPHEA